MIKIIFLFILVIHGLIHLLGFVKAFNPSQIEQLTLAISKPLGLVWLFSALLLFIIGVLVFLNNEWVWIPAIIAMIISQTLIILSWHDAKFGTIPNVIILIFVVFSFANWNFNAQVDKEIESLLSQANKSKPKIITEQMIAPLPSPVQRWLNHIGLVGKEQIQIAYFKQRGQMKLKPDQKEWAPAQVEQYVTTDLPGFLWKVDLKMIPAIKVVGRDKFQQGKAAMTIKIGSLYPVVNEANNDKMNQSTLQRYLLELPWYPSAALSPYITWEEIDQNSAKATMTYEGVTGSATFYFDDSGDFIKVSAMRYKDNDEKAKLVECIGEANETRKMDGIKIPTKLNVTWIMDDGRFTWYKLEILKAKYN